MTDDAPELTGRETEALRRIDLLLQRRFAGIAPDRRFDERVLDHLREFDAAQLAARRAQAERQFARMTSTLTYHWRSTRHVLVATLAAVTTTVGVVGYALRDALAHTFASVLGSGLAVLEVAPLPWLLTAAALAAIALGWAISTRVKL